MRDEKIEKEKRRKWNWYMFFYTLAKGDPLKFEEVGKLNFIFALNLKAFEKTYPQIREQYGK